MKKSRKQAITDSQHKNLSSIYHFLDQLKDSNLTVHTNYNQPIVNKINNNLTKETSVFNDNLLNDEQDNNIHKTNEHTTIDDNFLLNSLIELKKFIKDEKTQEEIENLIKSLF